MATTVLEERIVVGRTRLPWQQRLSVQQWFRAVLQDLRHLVRARFVLRNHVVNQLKVRYQRSALGFLWTLVNPILMLTVQAAVFSQIFKQDLRDFAVYLFSGLVAWQFFSACIENGSRSLINNEYLIRKVYVPKLIFPLADVLVALVNMCFATGALALVFFVLGAPLRHQVIVFPAAVALMSLFTFGVVLISMTLLTYFRDFEHMISVFLQAFFYATPVIYKPEMLGKFAPYIKLNPMTHFLELFHIALYTPKDPVAAALWPSAATWQAAILSALGTLLIGYLLYKNREHEYIFRL